MEECPVLCPELDDEEVGVGFVGH